MEDSDILQLMGMDVSHPNNVSDLNNEVNTRKVFPCADYDISSRYHVEGSYDGRMSLPFMIAVLVLGFITFFVNLGVIIRTIKILRHGHNSKPSFYYIGNLALSDLAIGLYIIIAFLLHITQKSNLWQKSTCTLQIAVAVTACQETIFTIMLIAVDKYLYICHALKYHQIVTIKRVYIVVILSWLISLIIGSLPALGMHVQLSTLCGRCIFAEVVSKDFAILFFVTAVVLPYAVIVSLYGILLVLAIKVQRARYGGNLRAPSSTGKSNFRLTFMSRTPTGFKSRTSTTKSTTSRITISTTASTKSGISISKSNRRRVRKQAKEEYKAALPDNREIAIKLIKDNQTEETLSTKPKEEVLAREGEIREELIQDDAMAKESNVVHSQELVSGSENSRKSNEMGCINGEFPNSTTISSREKLNTVNDKSSHDSFSKIEEDNGNNGTTHISEQNEERVDSSVESASAKENCGQAKVNNAGLITDVNYVNDNEKLQNEDYLKQQTVSQTHQALPSESNSKRLSETPSTISHISSKDLPPLESTDDEEVIVNDKSKNWSLPKYFNRVVADTRDRVLFLKKCQAVKTVFLIIGSFTATYVPFVIGSLVYSVQEEKNRKLLHVLQTLLYCAVVANSLANPLMYAYGYKEFRIRTKKFKGVFAREKKPKV